jgi:hypothetical protein
MRPSITLDRSRRLCRLVNMLGQQPATRETLSRRLGVETRGFYRDLGLVREAGVPVTLEGGRYGLGEPVPDALRRLPFPDPLVSLGEARLLAQGSSPAHVKLRNLIDQVIS